MTGIRPYCLMRLAAATLVVAASALAQNPQTGTVDEGNGAQNGSASPGAPKPSPSPRPIPQRCPPADLEFDLDMNQSPISPHACYFVYLGDPNSTTSAPTLYLFDDQGQNYYPVRLGTLDVASNSQCTIKGTGSSASLASGAFSISVNVTFAAEWAGVTIDFFEQAVDNSAWPVLTSGWLQISGTSFLVTGTSQGNPTLGPITAPSAVTADPYTNANASLNFSVSDPNGWGQINGVNGVITANQTGTNACFWVMFPYFNAVYLFNDDLSSWTYTQFNNTNGGAVSNSTCTITAQGSGWVVGQNNNAGSLTLTMGFQVPATYAFDEYVTDELGNNSGWGAPTGTVLVNPQLTMSSPVNNGQLPKGLAGAWYSLQTFIAAGGTSPYVWSATGLPPGLTFSNGIFERHTNGSGILQPCHYVDRLRWRIPAGHVLHDHSGLRIDPALGRHTRSGGASTTVYVYSNTGTGLSGQITLSSTPPLGIGLTLSASTIAVGGSFNVTITPTFRQGIDAPITAPYTITLPITAAYSGQGQQVTKVLLVPITVNPFPTFTVSAASTTLNLQPVPGQYGPFTQTIAGHNGFTGSVVIGAVTVWYVNTSGQFVPITTNGNGPIGIVINGSTVPTLGAGQMATITQYVGIDTTIPTNTTYEFQFTVSGAQSYGSGYYPATSIVVQFWANMGTVPPFNITGIPASTAVSANGVTPVTVTVSPVNGSTPSQVTFAVSNGYYADTIVNRPTSSPAWRSWQATFNPAGAREPGERGS